MTAARPCDIFAGIVPADAPAILAPQSAAARASGPRWSDWRLAAVAGVDRCVASSGRDQPKPQRAGRGQHPVVAAAARAEKRSDAIAQAKRKT